MARSFVLGGLLALAAIAAACGASHPALTPLHRHRVIRESNAVVHVQDRWLLVHLAQPVDKPPPAVFVLYVTGDRGWAGKDLDTYEHLRTWGHPTAGFSAPDYLNNLSGGADSLPPRTLARDFEEIIASASSMLGVPQGTPVVLVGVSRGADLVVVAAAEREIRRDLAGVVAVALTDEEEYVRRRPRRLFGHREGKPLPEPPLEMVRPYEFLPRIDSPISLIQSTNDEYVPAARAAVQFGPQSSTRRFYAIESRNHSFADARDAMYRALHASLEWVVGAFRPHAAGGPHS